jgi:hypothetical protein
MMNESQASVVSSDSSNLGLLGQAGKLVSSVLGVSKKAKTEVKSLQLAAVAAKKVRQEYFFTRILSDFVIHSNKRRWTRKLLD